MDEADEQAAAATAVIAAPASLPPAPASLPTAAAAPAAAAPAAAAAAPSAAAAVETVEIAVTTTPPAPPAVAAEPAEPAEAAPATEPAEPAPANKAPERRSMTKIMRHGSLVLRDTDVPKTCATSFFTDMLALTGEIYDAILVALADDDDDTPVAENERGLTLFELYAVLRLIDANDRASSEAAKSVVASSGVAIKHLATVGLAAGSDGGEEWQPLAAKEHFFPVVPARRVTGTTECFEDLAGRISLAIKLLSGGDLFPPLKLRVYAHEFADVLLHVTHIRELRIGTGGEHSKPRIACFVGNRRSRLVAALRGPIDATALRASAAEACAANDALELPRDLRSRWPTIRRELTFKKLLRPDSVGMGGEGGGEDAERGANELSGESDEEAGDPDGDKVGDSRWDTAHPFRSTSVADRVDAMEMGAEEISLCLLMSEMIHHIKNDRGRTDKERGLALLRYRRQFFNLARKVFWWSIPILVVILWVVTGTLWYSLYLEWDFTKAFYYAVQAGLSVGFGSLTEERKNDGTPWCEVADSPAPAPGPGGVAGATPSKRQWRYKDDGICWKSDISKMFTVVHVLIGAMFAGAALSVFVDIMMKKKTEWEGMQKVEKKKVRLHRRREQLARKVKRKLAKRARLSLEGIVIGDDEGADDSGGDAPEDEPVTAKEPHVVGSRRHACCAAVQTAITEEWRTLVVYLIFFLWVGFGTLYGLLREDWSIFTSVYFAITAMSTGGLQGPSPGKDNGNMGFVGFYCLVGVPIFGAFVGVIGSSFFSIIFRHSDAKQTSTLDHYSRELLHEVGTCWDSPTRLGEIDATDWLAFAVLRQGLMEKAELKELMRKFKEINMDGSGMVQSGQLALYTIFQILDVDGSGTLELNEIEDAVDRLIDLGVITTIPRSCRTAEALHAIVKDHFEMSANQYSATQATSRLRSNEVDSLDYLEFLEFTNSLKEAFAALDGDGDGAYAEEVHRNRFTI